MNADDIANSVNTVLGNPEGTERTSNCIIFLKLTEEDETIEELKDEGP